MRRVSSLQPITALDAVVKPGRSTRKSLDVVSQCTQLARVSSDPSIWKVALETVTKSISVLKGEDIATVLRASSRVGVRDELMLASVCESLKTLPMLRVLRVRDIASIFSSFHRLNFAPSVETLNALGAEVIRSLPLYRTRSQDLCLLFRYFSILQRNPDLIVNYNNQFQYPQITQKLETAIEERIGQFGPAELSIIAKYASRVSLKSLMQNFSRQEHVKPAVREFFFKQLDKRFGEDAWRQYAHLLTVDKDSTGWNRPLPEHEEDVFGLWGNELVKSELSERPPLFQLQDRLVQEALDSTRSPNGKWRRTKKENPVVKPATGLSDEQLEFLKMIEQEMGDEHQQESETVKLFSQSVDRKLVRDLDRSDVRGKPEPPEVRAMRQFKSSRQKHLNRFSLLVDKR